MVKNRVSNLAQVYTAIQLVYVAVAMSRLGFPASAKSRWHRNKSQRSDRCSF